MRSCIKLSSSRSSSSSNFKKNIYNNNELFLGIQHYTNVNNCIKILETEKIISKIQAIRENIDFNQISSTGTKHISQYEFPGVYTSLILNKSIGKPIRMYKNDPPVILIFSKVLLKQNNYHIRPFDNMGLIDQDTFTKKNLIDNYYKYLIKYDDNELVFHDPISTNCLESIFVDNQEVYDELLLKIPKKYKSKLRFVDRYPDENYNKYCDMAIKELNNKKIINTKLRPNFCHVPGGTPENVIKKFAENCGIKPKLIENMDKSTLLQMIRSQMEEQNFKGIRIKPKWIPGINLF